MIHELGINQFEICSKTEDPAVQYPCFAMRMDNGGYASPKNDTLYLFTLGHGEIQYKGAEYPIVPFTYAVIPGEAMVTVKGTTVLILRKSYTGLFHIGQGLEPSGRLKYIDGCSDTLLCAPPKMGDPCLNHLHFPPGIVQTMHTHPTARIGMVVAGSGECVTPTGRKELKPGLCWYLEAGDEHCFYTHDSRLEIVAFHPDSTTGPTDDNHPMLNRTMVDGVSAAEIDTIRTKAITV